MSSLRYAIDTKTFNQSINQKLKLNSVEHCSHCTETTKNQEKKEKKRHVLSLNLNDDSVVDDVNSGCVPVAISA